ncbi:MAG: hypothetical protein ACYDAG_09875, partial [Chloroflexota bacterium]
VLRSETVTIEGRRVTLFTAGMAPAEIPHRVHFVPVNAADYFIGLLGVGLGQSDPPPDRGCNRRLPQNHCP